ncbi:hypothetical protein AKJ57_02525 [candidate division MSBL1 archaeon SCGC-AAA259A05]|uniref:Enolase C-terminal domain-containing protein n=1 Tax=candidate division MSBL1 archaeon SCGC-AAA259A05 TaxID=1698259 RepID=A0A133UA44_9EURY|nr:hypothetical protein AKJ57_02525 [candidate division MSBL1 archaeon SCGC-AAA259A05]
MGFDEVSSIHHLHIWSLSSEEKVLPCHICSASWEEIDQDELIRKIENQLREVGQSCDEEGFFWLEDPYRDCGISQQAHKKLRKLIDTPILQTEHIRGLEIHTDFIANEATDYLRADPDYDAGITGAMKIARMTEGFGLDVEFHSAEPAQRHCMAATRGWSLSV